MSWFKRIIQRKKPKKKLKTERPLFITWERTVQDFIKSKEGKAVDVLVEIFITDDRQSVQLSFKERWRNMEKVNKIETLISMEKEITSMRKELCKEMYEMSKRKL